MSVSSTKILDLSLATNNVPTFIADVPCRTLSLNRREIGGAGDRSLVRIFFGSTRIYCPSTCHPEHVPIAYAIQFRINKTF